MNRQLFLVIGRNVSSPQKERIVLKDIPSFIRRKRILFAIGLNLNFIDKKIRV
jgi:hypothetical protein